MNMIEKVAKAIDKSREMNGRINSIDDAKAAIVAMREPTEEMLTAVNYEAVASNNDVNLKVQYQSMIDAALKD